MAVSEGGTERQYRLPLAKIVVSRFWRCIIWRVEPVEFQIDSVSGTFGDEYAIMVKNVLKRVEKRYETNDDVEKGIYSVNEWWRTNWRKRISMVKRIWGIEWYRSMEIEIVGIWFNSFYLELCLKRWKGKFCLRDWRVLIEKWDFVWRIETFTLITSASEIGKFYSSHWKV